MKGRKEKEKGKVKGKSNEFFFSTLNLIEVFYAFSINFRPSKKF